MQKVYANLLMMEKLLDLIDKGRDSPDIWRSTDTLMLDIASILASISEEIEAHYDVDEILEEVQN